jgi:hypothetical protein
LEFPEKFRTRKNPFEALRILETFFAGEMNNEPTLAAPIAESAAAKNLSRGHSIVSFCALAASTVYFDAASESGPAYPGPHLSEASVV